jgi:hypothetical protein
MISYNDLDFAIARWKARAGGVPQPAQPVSGAVETEVPVANAPEGGAVSDENPMTASGLIVIQPGEPGEDEPQHPDQQDPDQK